MTGHCLNRKLSFERHTLYHFTCEINFLSIRQNGFAPAFELGGQGKRESFIKTELGVLTYQLNVSSDGDYYKNLDQYVFFWYRKKDALSYGKAYIQAWKKHVKCPQKFFLISVSGKELLSKVDPSSIFVSSVNSGAKGRTKQDKQFTNYSWKDFLKKSIRVKEVQVKARVPQECIVKAEQYETL
ncbi:hypothetical protein BFX06_09845 [Sulfobacillus thermosulfidooxidans]|nr:hypothetical protein BFX05_07920 [Sulfobacillus thermosulfidooxidans]OLZ13463.1 hypothetical protein BFX06_09845 [Sulfobacillus thermosulfidooxidans]OLZ21710.1 hypothetical protein BFX07_12895 [Sulfobacillus thermosulfidooxidans]